MNNSNIVTKGGWALIIFAMLFLGIQIYLRMVFGFTAVLHGPGLDQLPVLLAAGQGHHFLIVLTIFSLLPLLLVPGSIGAYHAFKEQNEPGMRIAMVFAFIAAIAFVLSLMQWPSSNMAMTSVYAAADAGQRGVLAGVLTAFNSYFGTYVGGFLTAFSASIWFFMTGTIMLKAKDFPKWIAYFGIIVAVFMFIDMIENFGIFPAWFSQVVHYIEPIDVVWLLVFGIGLLMHKDAR